MPRGGRRSTTWKPTWKHGKTRTIRVPIVLTESILNLARILDEGKEVLPNSLVTDNTGENNSHVTDNKNGAVEKLDPNDVSASIEALTTAISMKQIAISKGRCLFWNEMIDLKQKCNVLDVTANR